MMTGPGENRKLYFDYNIISEATTTNPFTTLDLDFYNKVPGAVLGISFQVAEEMGWQMFSDNADMMLFNSSTRQYMNMSLALKYVSTEYMSEVRSTIQRTTSLTSCIGICVCNL